MMNSICNKEVVHFKNDSVHNRVVKFVHDTSSDMCIFIPNWRAKPHHWDGFCNQLSQHINLDYFETREKPSTKILRGKINYDNEATAMDIIHYLNTHPCYDYHLILCSFSVPLVMSKWDELKYKPKTLTMICPITQVLLPWPVKLFVNVPKPVLPYLHKMIYSLASKTSAVKPICKNHVDLFRKGNIKELSQFQDAVKDVLKLRVGIDVFEKLEVPTMIIKPLHDKIHSAGTCQKISSRLKNPAVHEVENFRNAHSMEVAKEIHNFIDRHLITKKIVFKEWATEIVN